MTSIQPTPIDRYQFSDLRVVLRSRAFDDKRDDYIRVEGLHPRCGGRCTIISEFTEGNGQQCSVIKPHVKCDPVACLDSRIAVCSGSMVSLKHNLLDSNKLSS